MPEQPEHEGAGGAVGKQPGEADPDLGVGASEVAGARAAGGQGAGNGLRWHAVPGAMLDDPVLDASDQGLVPAGGRGCAAERAGGLVPDVGGHCARFGDDDADALAVRQSAVRAGDGFGPGAGPLLRESRAVPALTTTTATVAQIKVSHRAAPIQLLAWIVSAAMSRTVCIKTMRNRLPLVLL